MNSSSHHDRIVSFFSTTFLQEEPTLLEKLLLLRKGEFKVLLILNLSTSDDAPKPSEVPVLLLASDFMDCCEFFKERVDYLICGLLMDFEDSFTGTCMGLDGLVRQSLLSPYMLFISCLLLGIAPS